MSARRAQELPYREPTRYQQRHGSGLATKRAATLVYLHEARYRVVRGIVKREFKNSDGGITVRIIPADFQESPRDRTTSQLYLANVLRGVADLAENGAFHEAYETLDQIREDLIVAREEEKNGQAKTVER